MLAKLGKFDRFWINLNRKSGGVTPIFRQRFLAASTFWRGKVAAVSNVKSKLVVEYWNTKTTQNYIQFLKLEDKKLPTS